MAKKILLVFEGPRTEKQIANSLSKFFLQDKTVIHFAYCAEIYQLYDKIFADEYLDTFALLKEQPANISDLSGFDRTDFAEIYLFFDYEGQASTADDDKVRKLLELFDEETNSGKLLISYPMVESIKHLSGNVDFKNLKVPAKENIGYKEIVGREAHKRIQNLTQWSLNDWIYVIKTHLSKANYVVNNDFNLPSVLLSQIEIFTNQRKKHIEVDSTVAVLSGFPLFLQGYYGVARINRTLEKK